MHFFDERLGKIKKGDWLKGADGQSGLVYSYDNIEYRIVFHNKHNYPTSTYELANWLKNNPNAQKSKAVFNYEPSAGASRLLSRLKVILGNS